ncbi:MAG: hypothetical protein JWO67_6456 [Streptosporangiaceae bacterium]|nr:hypothetical protein [Streptosporangiaceae bacterium]
MGMTICNRYTARVYVAIGFLDNSCPHNTGPHIMGWWGIDPGGCALVYANDVDQYSPVWYYVAEAVDGAVWAGQYVVEVPNEAFNRCWYPGVSGGYSRGFRGFYVGSVDDYTLTLTA